MIPKVIHYFWFGNNKKTRLIHKCIKSWKKFLPDYKIVEWNETNVDLINAPQYVKDAYENKKYAFVADYFRFWAIYNYGGIYLDTDMQIIKNIDLFLSYSSVIGFGSKEEIAGGIICSEKDNSLIKQLMDSYSISSFFIDGKMNLTTIVDRITKVYKKAGFLLNNSLQIIQGNAVFPQEYFYAKDYFTKKITITNNTYAIHHYDGSWLSKKERLILKTPNWILKIYKKVRHGK